MSITNNIKSLHVIRGIAALIVAVYHAKFVLWSGGEMYLKEIGLHNFFDYFLFAIDMLSSCGKQCVLVFFILSGFVIHHSYKNSTKNLKHFYIIRLIRIYIPFIASLIFSIAIILIAQKLNSKIFVDGGREYNSRLLAASNDLNIFSVLKSLIFIKSEEYPGYNFGYWSLLHEGIFYLVFPFYTYLNSKRNYLIPALAISSFILKSDYLYYQIYFLLGMFLSDFYQSNKKLFVITNGKPIVFYLMLISGFILTNVLTKIKINYLADFMAVITTIVAFDFIIIHGIKTNKWLTKLSDMSFSLYLNHLPILLMCYCVFSLYLDKIIFYERYPYYISILVAIFGSYLIYFVVEKNSLALISKIKSKWN